MKRFSKENMKRMFGTRFKMGSYSAFAAVIVIVIAIFANSLVSALPSSVTRPDLTGQSLFSLSEQTKRIAASVDKDVDLYLLTTSGNEDSTILRLLERYADLNDHIRVTSVDPSEKPTFLDAYDLSASRLYANSVLVDCGGRYRLVSYTDIYVTTYDMDYYSYNYTATTEFDGENVLTNAIHYVSCDDLPKIYILSGHGETELDESVTEMLAQDNMETESLSLLTLESVPEDADVIVINAPQSDLGDEETALLIEWMQGGGQLALISDYIAEGEMTNLLSLTASMGLTVNNGLVIEGDSGMHVTRYPYYLLPDIESHEITDALISGGYYILMTLAQGIVESGDDATEITWLLSTSSDAYTKAAGLETETVEKEDGDETGTYHLGAASRSGDAKLVWFASAQMLNDSINRTVSGANRDLFLNALNWMSGQEESISIRAKTLESETLTVTGSQSSFWSVVMIGLIPLTFTAIGVGIVIRRKRK